jgi:hypothetical protein
MFTGKQVSFEIICTAVEALRKNERQRETQFITEIDGFLSPPTPS